MKKAAERICDLSLPLILGILVALIWANLGYESYSTLLHGKIIGNIDFHFLVNDVFLVFFFGLATVEIVHGLSPNGNLYPIKNTISNLCGAAGGVVMPAIIFIGLSFFFGHRDYYNGWAIPTATDVAVSLLFANLIFGKKHAAYSFLLLLAIADDVFGLAIIALFYPDPSSPVQLEYLGLVAVAIAIAWSFRKMNVKHYLFYIAIAGLIAWFGMMQAKLHPSLALVFIVPFIPHSKGLFEKKSSLDKFENKFKPFVDFGLFFFGLANAGVVLSSVSVLTFIVFISLFAGKTIGIFGMTKIATYFGFPLNKSIGNAELLVTCMIASIGLTVSLFISDIAYTDYHLKDAAKMGALFSLFSGFIALAVAKKFIKKKPKFLGKK